MDKKITNLATLIGVKNLLLLVNDKRNTHVLISSDTNTFTCVANDYKVDYSKVIGIGSESKCINLINHLRFD